MATGNVVKDKNFKSGGDFINSLLSKYVDEKGKIDEKAITEICKENGAPLKSKYPNPGMLRMNAGNMLRARAKKRHGLMVKGKWIAAPQGFTSGDPVEDRQGNKIAKAKPAGNGKAEKAAPASK